MKKNKIRYTINYIDYLDFCVVNANGNGENVNVQFQKLGTR